MLCQDDRSLQKTGHEIADFGGAVGHTRVFA
jgi:hypothetical protein